MKIMIVGNWRWYQYEESFATGLEFHGVQVFRFSTSDYFLGTFGKIITILPIPGWTLFILSRDLIKITKQLCPDWIIFWRPTHILPSTLKSIRNRGIKIVSYNNDDPFSRISHNYLPWHQQFMWFWYLRCLPLFDRNYFYRKINCQEALKYGAKHPKVLMPYFIPSKDRPIKLSSVDQIRFNTDIVFVGHYEPDGRNHSILALIEAGYKVKIWGGPYWTHKVLGDMFEYLQPIKPAEGEDYIKALCGAKICLAFLSKLNRDTYTRRCFEIPACGCLMLAERTDDLTQLFIEDKEACFFSSVEELVSKVKWLLENPELRNQIASAGHSRVWSDGHDVYSRAKYFLATLYE